MSVRSSGNNNSGCGFAIVAFVVLAMALAVLKAIWWLLLILAAAAAVAALVVRKKAAQREAPAAEPDPCYTQKCPNCGAQIEVSVYEPFAKCGYCGSSSLAEHAPLERPQPDEGARGFFSDPFKVLLATAAVLAVLGLVGLGYAISSESTGTASHAAEPASNVSSGV